MLDELEYLLITLGEEGCEIAERASKAVRFGLHEIQPGQPLDNKRRIEQEIGDLIGTMRMLGFTFHEEDVLAKQEKLKRFMEYSRQVGRLKPELDEDKIEVYRKALEECREKLMYAHDGGCVLPLRDIVNRALGHEPAPPPADNPCRCAEAKLKGGESAKCDWCIDMAKKCGEWTEWGQCVAYKPCAAHPHRK